MFSGTARQDASQGDQEGANLKVVLQNLGVADDEMHGDDHCEWKGIECERVQDELCVTSIDFEDQNLTGRLSPEVGKLRRLTHLWLGENRQLSASLQALSTLTRLEQLELPNTLVTGELDALKNLTQLQFLNLFQTPVDGKLEALTNLTKLEELILSRTRVSGRLEDLKHCERAMRITLAETEISGDLKALTDLHELQHLDLSKTETAGDIEDLLQWKSLNQALLRQTQVTGQLTPKWHEMLTELNILDLAVHA